MGKVISERASETAKKVRKALKEAFPDYPARHFSVRSSSYSGGSSLSVNWDDYPTQKDVNAVVKKFESAGYDGMQDMKTYTPYEYEGKLYSGADYISASRNVSEERINKAIAVMNHVSIESEQYNENDYQLRRKMWEIEEKLDADLNYTGTEDISGLVFDGVVEDVEDAEANLEVEVNNAIEEYAFWLLSASGEGVKGWSRGGKDKLIDSLRMATNVNRVHIQLRKPDNTYSVVQVVGRVSDILEERLVSEYGGGTASLEAVAKSVEEVVENNEGEVEEVELTAGDKAYTNNRMMQLILEFASVGKVVNKLSLKEKFDEEAVRNLKANAGELPFKDVVEAYLVHICEESVETTAVVDVGIEEETGIRVVIKALQEEDMVTLVFKKADGTQRIMIATRNNEVEPSITAINQPMEVVKQIERGVIPVWDMQKKEIRAFRAERLTSYTVNGETVEYGVEAAEGVNPEEHFDPTTLSTSQMIGVLGTSVVRLVFKKSDGTTRVMWGTRNKDVIGLYMNPGNPMVAVKENDYDTAQKRQAQIDRDYVQVFDLTADEFRTFKPSTVERVDEQHGVASWIEFKPKQDGWYNCAKSGEGIANYYELGKRKAKDSEERMNESRVQEEREKVQHVASVKFTREQLASEKARREEGEDERVATAEARRLRWSMTNQKVQEALAEIETYTEQEEEAFRKMKTYVEKLQETFHKLQSEGKGRGEIENLNIRESHKIIMFGYEEDVYLLHPRFIVNGISHRVFADRTGKFEYEGNAQSADGDTELRRELQALATLVSGRRKRDATDVRLVEEDIRRLRRFNALQEKYKQKFIDEKITAILNRGNEGMPPHLQVTVDGKRFVVSPAILYSVDTKAVHYRRERHTATLREFREAVTGHEQIGVSESSFKVLVTVLVESYDLRKRVEDTEGTAI